MKQFASPFDNLGFRAGILYDLAHRSAQEGGIPPGEAYRGVQNLLRRRPDSARLHFMASRILREAGLLEESAREREASMIIDAKDAGSPILRRDIHAARQLFTRPGLLAARRKSGNLQDVLIDILLRQGKVRELLQSSQKLPEWSGYDMVLAYLQHHSQQTMAMAHHLQPAPDAETNYLSATHLSYVGETEAALAMLKRTVGEGYCSYPGMDSDPLLSNLRSNPEFPEIREAGMRCQSTFSRDAAAMPGR